MKKLMENKLSITMREALARNTLMENKMKADVSTISSDAKRNLQSLEFSKHKYEARQKQLQIEKQRRASSGNGARKISAPSRLMMNVEYQDLSSGEIVTDLTRFQKKERSTSDTALPPIYRWENSGKLPELVANSKSEGLLLPTIGQLSVNNNGRQRRLSATNLSPQSGTPGGFLTAPVNTGQSRSAPSSPRTPRRVYSRWARTPSPVGFRKSSTEDFGEELARQLDKALLQQKASDKDANVKDESLDEEEQKAMQEPESSPNSEKLASVNRERKEVQMTRKISSPGAMLQSTAASTASNALNPERQKSLEESMNDVRFCKYLRTSSLEEDIKQGLPDVLVPKVIIVGHTEWVPGD